MTEFPPLDEELAEATPFPFFQRWFDEAVRLGLPDPDAMTLATVSPEGNPSARVVLLRGHGEGGFTFFTNYLGRKAVDLSLNPRAALVFFWPQLHRQVRIEGTADKVSERESDDYFRSRPFGHRLGALASPQSEVIPDRRVLEENLAQLAKQFEGLEVPRPSTWGGYRVSPNSIEFWQGRPNRLHDRLRYRLRPDGSWIKERLAP